MKHYCDLQTIDFVTRPPSIKVHKAIDLNGETHEVARGKHGGWLITRNDGTLYLYNILADAKRHISTALTADI